jgi:uncharacterized protein
MRIAAALIVTMMVGAAYAQTTPSRESFITVAGEGHVNVAPDFAEFFADVVTRGESLDAATRQHTERTTKANVVLRSLARLNVNVERSSFRLEHTRATRGADKKAAFDYRAITTFALKANQLASLNEVISTIAAANLFEVRTVRYGIKDEERAIDDARRAAVKDARRQAEVYADAAGVKLAEILEIFDGVAQNLGSEASLRAATPNVQVPPPATIPFRAGINIKWRIVAK